MTMTTKMAKIIRLKIQEIKSLFTTKKGIVLIISRLFCSLFMYTAIMKVIGHEKFQLEMSKSPIITDFADILVWAVPAGEVILAALVYFEETMLIGLYASLGAMSLFTAYIYAILHFSDSIPCACMGVFEKMGFEAHLVFNIVFVVLAITGIFLKDEIDRNVHRHPELVSGPHED